MSTRTTIPEGYFSAVRADYSAHSLNTALDAGTITADDKALIMEFTNERQASANISQSRVNKLTSMLVGWRRFVGEFRTLSIVDVYAGVDILKKGNSEKGRPFKQNTISDLVTILKQFVLWMIEEGYSKIPEKKIARIKTPPKEMVTKKASDLLTTDEITLIMKACERSGDRAMILLLYEGGFRIGEIATLTWGDIQFVGDGVSIGVLFKTKYYRHIRVVMAAEYLKVGKADYPLEPTSDALVFLNGVKKPFIHSTISKRIQRIVLRAGITRHVTPHIFRHSRITHLIKEGMQESAIKMMMWGQPDTTMWKTYVHMTGQDIDTEVARMYGIVDKKDADTDPGIRPRQCKHCSSINPPLAFTCYTCGEPLDSTGALKLEEVARFIVEHGSELQEYIAAFVSKPPSPA